MSYRKLAIPLRQTILLVITDDCNLRCRYCYEHSKAPHRMSWETAKKAIDFFLDLYKDSPFEGVIFELIGGEPFLEIDLVDKICEYVPQALKGHVWQDNYMFSFTTNGTLLDDPKVRAFMLKDRRHKSIGISVDGVKEIHDYNRSNSFDKVMENWNFWRALYPWDAVKATINSESLPYLFESVKFLFSLGLSEVLINTANENLWRPGDPKIYYDQLTKIADWLLEDRRYEKLYCALLDEHILEQPDPDHNWCGCGTCTAAVDWTGTIFPCLRFKFMDKEKPWDIGHIDTGIDENKVTPFYFCHHLRDCKCADCDTQAGCATCCALNYDETGTIYKRAGYVCGLHKARVAVNKYFFGKLLEMKREEGKDQSE